MMESFSRTLDTYTDSYVARRRRKRLLVGGLVLVLLAGLGVGIFLITKASPAGQSGKAASKAKVLAAWEAGSWDEVLALCEASIQQKPLDPFYLAFEGLSSFYKANELPEGEERSALVDQAVVSLRKTLVVAEKGRGAGVPKAELEYVLGKACYFKGSAYWDETVSWLESSVAGHYIARDSWEYLAVAYDGLGKREKSIEYFEKALARQRSDLLLIAAAKAYIGAGMDSRGESLLLEALATSADALTRERCRFLLADLYLGRGEVQKSREQLLLVIEGNSESSEAHYRLGLILQKQGDSVGARSEWRKAVAIDPMNMEARQKLSEKL